MFTRQSLTCRNCSSNVHDWASLFRAMDGEWTSVFRWLDIWTSPPEWLDFGDKSEAPADCLCAAVNDMGTPDDCCWCCSGDGCTDRPGCWYTRCWSIGAISREPDASCLASWLSVSRSSRWKLKTRWNIEFVSLLLDLKDYKGQSVLVEYKDLNLRRFA